MPVFAGGSTGAAIGPHNILAEFFFNQDQLANDPPLALAEMLAAADNNNAPNAEGPANAVVGLPGFAVVIDEGNEDVELPDLLPPEPEAAANAPPQPQAAAMDPAPLQQIVLEAPVGAVQNFLLGGFGDLANQLLIPAAFGHHHAPGLGAALLNNLNIDLDIDALAAVPHLHMGFLPEDLAALFHGNLNQGTPQHIASMRMLKKRILVLRERKPHYWHRIAFGLFKRTLRGQAGGCDAKILVQPKQPSDTTNPTVIWVHKFIVVKNQVFRQLLGYRKIEDCLQDEGGPVSEIDMPSATAEVMRSIVMAAYDLPQHKLNLESAWNLEPWADRFCMDELAKRCRSIIRTAPDR
ncbi:uncharacterized protein LOC129597575 [Paramacrobiotus metropolitanus]|uniref:uncharacterized protein LOC129597575 n=1 Tax=Paramacrobiotus metropolitanus TaxID=2943436 RepID=UPI002445C1B3|nr:uncharacterized protein LOC129597575 [Paramacrobiotus metropolitanus]